MPGASSAARRRAHGEHRAPGPPPPAPHAALREARAHWPHELLAAQGTLLRRDTRAPAPGVRGVSGASVWRGTALNELETICIIRVNAHLNSTRTPTVTAGHTVHFKHSNHSLVDGIVGVGVDRFEPVVRVLLSPSRQSVFQQARLLRWRWRCRHYLLPLGITSTLDPKEDAELLKCDLT